MLKEYLLNLQLFGEGGDGGAAADSGATGEGSEGFSGDEELARIPERAREMYKKAALKHKPTSQPQPTEEAPADDDKPAKMSYADLIKSDEYKEEHKAYMDKTIGDRLKKYKGIEESNKKMADALGIVANKYGLDPEADDFMEQLTGKISSDNSYYEEYAMQHDISTEEAKEILGLKQQVAAQKREEALRAKAQEEMDREAQQKAMLEELRANAERTKAKYPSFDLDLEMQNEKFRRLCAVNNGDTTAAYWAIHHDELMNAQSQVLAQQASQQAANNIAANRSRPIENGLSSQASAVTTTDWSKASLAQIREQAAIWRRG